MTESIDFSTAWSYDEACSKILVRILSATYGPSHERRLMHGEVVPVDASLRMPYTRDVLPFISAYLYHHITQPDLLQEPLQSGYLLKGEGSWDATSVGDEASCKRRKTDNDRCNEVALMDGKSMNIIFGDPCPGTTKRLDLTYVFKDDIKHGSDKGSEFFDHSFICHASFAEHEQVVLKRKIIPLSRSRNKLPPLQNQVRQHGPCKIDPPKLQSLEGSQDLPDSTNKLPPNECLVEKDSVHVSGPSNKWRLRNEISEIAFPLVLPYLSLTQRLHCQQVCKIWKLVISEQGVAECIDINEPFYGATKKRYTNKVLRGIISNSYPSLRRLFLNNYTALSPQDFHPAIPHLKKLTQLDVSRCVGLTDDTLLLIARYLKDTLEILYMKGLRNTSDVGLIAISESCYKLCILEISNVPITDASGTAIGRHLHRLVALYMRDNYLLTNTSLNAIVGGCPKLTQLTLWGCTRITNFQGEGWRTASSNPASTESINHIISHVSSETPNFNMNIPYSNLTAENNFFGARNLSVLNLWGCHGLQDDSFSFSGFHSAWNALGCLKTLIVSECHQLTDRFIVVPHLIHLHLRYLRRITDCSINAIASSMTQLYSIDLSFCNRISSSAIQHLLCTLSLGLAEIRLFNCHQIDEWAFNQIISTLESLPQTSLSILDVRECSIGRLDSNEDEAEAEANFLKRLSTPPFCFTEPVPHYYVRPAVMSTGLQQQFASHQLKIDEWAFNQIIRTLESLPQTSLSIHDVRECGISRLDSNEDEAEANFLKRLSTPPFCFTEPVTHYYVRPATGLQRQFATHQLKVINKY